MQATEKVQIKDFIDICNRLSQHRFFNETAELKIKLDKEGKGLHSLVGYDEDLLKSFLMDFRKIVMNDEPTQFYKIANILQVNNVKFKSKAQDIRNRYSNRYKVTPIQLETPAGKKEDIVNVWLYGEYFHEKNSINKDLIKDLRALKKQVFITTVIDLSNLAIELASLIEKNTPGKKTQKNNNSSPTKKEIDKAYGTIMGQELGDLAKKLIGHSTPERTEFTQYEQVRLFLFSASLLYEKNLTSEILGNHELHLAYKYREKINMFFSESWLILKTMISDQYDQKSGWYWYPNMTKKAVLSFTTKYFINSDNLDVKMGALDYMDRFWSKKYLEFMQILVNDESLKVRERVVKILRKYQYKENLKIIDILLKDKTESVRKSAFELYTDLLIKYDFRKAFSLLKSTSKLDDFHFKNISSLLRKLTKFELYEFISLEYVSLTIHSYRELIRRKALNNEKIKELLSNKQWDVRYIALHDQLNQGKKYTPDQINEILKSDDNMRDTLSRYTYGFSSFSKDDLLQQVYSGMEIEKMEPLIEWTSIEAPIIYEIYNRKTIKINKKHVRADLKDSYVNKKEIWLKRGATRANVSMDKMREIYNEYNDFITESFKQVGLRILLDFGSSKDLSLAKENIESSRYQTKQICINMIKKFGREKDSLYLLEIAEKEKLYDNSAIVGSLLLDKHRKYKIFERILDSKNSRHIKISIAFALKTNRSIPVETIELLLASENEGVRVSTVAYLSATSKHKVLLETLEKYTKNNNYYYNVVCWLDRITHSPKPLRKFFSNELKSLLENELKD